MFNSQIIAILAAILFPVFARAREKARQTSCLSNLKQLALADLMYAQDYDERTASYQDRPGKASEYRYYDMLDPYLNNEQIWACPSHDDERSYGPNITDMGVSNGTTGHTYLYCFRKIANFKYPAETAIYADSSGGYWRYRDGTAQYMQFRHNDGANVSFLDGHAKWVSKGFVLGEVGDWGNSVFLRGR